MQPPGDYVLQLYSRKLAEKRKTAAIKGTPHQAPQRERVSLVLRGGLQLQESGIAKRDITWKDRIVPDEVSGIPQLMWLLEPKVVFPHLRGHIESLGKAVEPAYSQGMFFEATDREGNLARGTYEGTYLELLANLEELASVLQRMSVAPALLPEPELELPLPPQLPRWDDYRPHVQALPAAPAPQPLKLPKFRPPPGEELPPFSQPVLFALPPIPPEDELEPLPEFSPPAAQPDLAADFEPPVFQSPVLPVLPEKPQAPGTQAPKYGEDWSGLRPYQVDEPVFIHPELLPVQDWRHPPANLPTPPLDMTVSADEELEVIAALETFDPALPTSQDEPSGADHNVEAQQAGPEPEPEPVVSADAIELQLQTGLAMGGHDSSIESTPSRVSSASRSRRSSRHSTADMPGSPSPASADPMPLPSEAPSSPEPLASSSKQHPESVVDAAEAAAGIKEGPRVIETTESLSGKPSRRSSAASRRASVDRASAEQAARPGSAARPMSAARRASRDNADQATQPAAAAGGPAQEGAAAPIGVAATAGAFAERPAVVLNAVQPALPPVVLPPAPFVQDRKPPLWKPMLDTPPIYEEPAQEPAQHATITFAATATPEPALPTPRPVAMAAGAAPVLLMDVSGTMHPSRGGKFNAMKHCVVDLLQAHSQVAGSAKEFDVIAFNGSAFSWSAAYEGRQDLLANLQQAYSGRQNGCCMKPRPTSAGPTSMRKQEARHLTLQCVEPKMLSEAADWVAAWPEAAGLTNYLGALQLASQHAAADCIYIFSDGLSDVSTCVLKEVESRLAAGERVLPIHTVGFFAHGERDGRGERFLRHLSSVTGGTFQEYDDTGFTMCKATAWVPPATPPQSQVAQTMPARDSDRLGIQSSPYKAADQPSAMTPLPDTPAASKAAMHVTTGSPQSARSLSPIWRDQQAIHASPAALQDDTISADHDLPLSASSGAWQGFQVQPQVQTSRRTTADTAASPKAAHPYTAGFAPPSLLTVALPTSSPSQPSSPPVGRLTPTMFEGVHSPTSPAAQATAPPSPMARRLSLSQGQPGSQVGQPTSPQYTSANEFSMFEDYSAMNDSQLTSLQALDAADAELSPIQSIAATETPATAFDTSAAAAAAAQDLDTDSLLEVVLARIKSVQADLQPAPASPTGAAAGSPKRSSPDAFSAAHYASVVDDESAAEQRSHDPFCTALDASWIDTAASVSAHPSRPSSPGMRQQPTIWAGDERDDTAKQAAAGQGWGSYMQRQAEAQRRVQEAEQHNADMLEHNRSRAQRREGQQAGWEAYNRAVLACYTDSIMQEVVMGSAIATAVNQMALSAARAAFDQQRQHARQHNAWLREMHAAEVAVYRAAKLGHEEALSQWVATKLADEKQHSEALVAARAQHTALVAQQRLEWADTQEALREEYEQHVEACKQAHAQECSAVEERNRERQKRRDVVIAERERVTDINDKRIAEAQAAYDQQCAEIKAAQAGHLREAQQQHTQACDKLRQNHDAAFAAVQQKYLQHKAAVTEWNDQANAAARARFQAAVTKLLAEHEAELAAARAAHAAELGEVRQRNELVLPAVRVATAAQAELDRVAAFMAHIRSCAIKMEIGVNYVPATPNLDRVVEMQTLTDALERTFPDLDVASYPWPRREADSKLKGAWTGQAPPTERESGANAAIAEIRKLLAAKPDRASRPSHEQIRPQTAPAGGSAASHRRCHHHQSTTHSPLSSYRPSTGGARPHSATPSYLQMGSTTRNAQPWSASGNSDSDSCASSQSPRESPRSVLPLDPPSALFHKGTQQLKHQPARKAIDDGARYRSVHRYRSSTSALSHAVYRG